MEVIVGSYNHVVFGFIFEKVEKGWVFQPRFTDQGHAGLVKTVSTGGRYLATGSSDETIRLFDLKKHIELGVLVQQTGTITCIQYSGASFMFSASEDGTICIWKTKSWECEKTLKGHRAAVTSFSIHPTGRLALSVSKDKTIRTWNLLTGRAVYTTNIKEVGEIVKWCPNGKAYAIVSGRKIQYHTVSGIEDTVTYEAAKYVLCIQFITDVVMIIGGEDEDIVIYNFEKNFVVQRFNAHKTRTKGLSLLDHPEDGSKYLLFTVASDGNLKAWTLNKENLEDSANLISSITIPGRPTCMTVYTPPQPKSTESETTVEVLNETDSRIKKKKKSTSMNEDYNS